ncbi:MAG: polysaccharide biosynthesis protein, partial [Thermodesulfobacteriota bacterium]
RDAVRLQRAMEGVDLVFHTAAMKQVPACEYNPLEAIKTNVIGAQNVLDAALNTGVKRVVNVTTDKAVNPVNLYGATKLCAEKIFVHGNAYSGGRPTIFSCCRYGNVVGSRGSVVPLFKEQRKTGRLTVTDIRMTRFWITLARVTRFLVGCAEIMRGGETFVPKMPSTNIVDLAKALAPECGIDIIGIRPGEKLHECLITVEESRSMLECEDMFIILPSISWFTPSTYPRPDCQVASASRGDFSYTSDGNDQWLTVEQVRDLIEESEAADGVLRRLRPVSRQAVAQALPA